MNPTRNQKQVAKLLASAYEALSVEDVRRLLDEADRLSRGDGQLLVVDADGGQDLTVDRMDYAR